EEAAAVSSPEIESTPPPRKKAKTPATKKAKTPARKAKTPAKGRYNIIFPSTKQLTPKKAVDLEKDLELSDTSSEEE
ncbi:hypothetical protein ACJMK2_006109, partial [Sinanodonta woodiana]